MWQYACILPHSQSGLISLKNIAVVLVYRSLAVTAPVYLADEFTLVTAAAAVLCGLLTIERAWSRDHATSSVTTVLQLPGQRCGTVCLKSFGNRTSPLDNSNNR